MYIVMESTAQMPTSCWGRYRRIAIVEWSPRLWANQKKRWKRDNQGKVMIGVPDWSRPKIIREGSYGILRIIRDRNCHVGKTDRDCATKTHKEFSALAEQLNVLPTAQGEQLIAAGSA